MGVKKFFIYLLIFLFFLFVFQKNIIQKRNCIFSEHHLMKHVNNFYLINHNTKKFIHIKTDVMDALIDLKDGNIKKIKLLNYQDQLNSFKKLKILNNNKYFNYKMTSGIIENNNQGNFVNYKHSLYHANDTNFELINGKKILYVPIYSIIYNGIQYRKVFIFKQGSYDVNIEYKLFNFNKSNFYFSVFGKLIKKNTFKNDIIYKKLILKNNFDHFSYSCDFIKYKNNTMDNIDKNINLHILTHKGWIAILQKYFAVAWFFNSTVENTVSFNHHTNSIIIKYVTSIFNIFPNQYKIFRTVSWIGPKIHDKMVLIDPYFHLTINYGWFYFLSDVLFKVLIFFYNILGNWGFSIILTILMIRIITFPLTKMQYVTTVKTKFLQPKIDLIKKNFKHDVKIMNEKILALYKDYGINSLNNFLPVIIQMPIFLSLYYVIINSIELRHSSFIFWIHDLSDKDPYYILPIIMGITSVLIQKTIFFYTPITLKDHIMHFLPMIFSLFFLWFPSGLVLYYIFSNIITVIQQLIINHNFKINK